MTQPALPDNALFTIISNLVKLFVIPNSLPEPSHPTESLRKVGLSFASRYLRNIPWSDLKSEHAFAGVSSSHWLTIEGGSSQTTQSGLSKTKLLWLQAGALGGVTVPFILTAFYSISNSCLACFSISRLVSNESTVAATIPSF